MAQHNSPQNLPKRYRIHYALCLQVLEQRQLKELTVLDSNFKTEKQLNIDQALSGLKLQYEKEKEKLLLRHKKEMQELMTTSGEQNFDSSKTDMHNKQLMEASRLEKKFLEDCDQLEASIIADLEVKHARDKIATRERHYQVSPDEP